MCCARASTCVRLARACREWNPASDKHLAQPYDITDFAEGKKANKAALQEELGLPVNPDIPLVAFIGRLDYQKGADIVLQAAPWMMAQGVQLVCLGTGTSDLEVRGGFACLLLLVWFQHRVA